MIISKVLFFLITAMITILLDQITKMSVILYNIQIYSTFLDINLIWNYGITFGILNNARYNKYFFIAISFLIIIILLYWAFSRKLLHQKITSSAIAMIAGGALGNIIDRIIHNAVCDFIGLHIGQYYWPSFNIADSSIVIGTLILMWKLP